MIETYISDSKGQFEYSREKDYKTSYSYFVEAFEQFDSVEDPRALNALKYMLVFDIILNKIDDVDKILSGTTGVKYRGLALDAIKAISVANKNRSILDFKLNMLIGFHLIR